MEAASICVVQKVTLLQKSIFFLAEPVFMRVRNADLDISSNKPIVNNPGNNQSSHFNCYISTQTSEDLPG